MKYFLWASVFSLCSIAVIFLLMFLVDKTVKRETEDVKFARKMDRFRFWVGKFTPPDKVKQFVILVLFILFCVYAGGTYDE